MKKELGRINLTSIHLDKWICGFNCVVSHRRQSWDPFHPLRADWTSSWPVFQNQILAPRKEEWPKASTSETEELSAVTRTSNSMPMDASETDNCCDKHLQSHTEWWPENAPGAKDLESTSFSGITLQHRSDYMENVELPSVLYFTAHSDIGAGFLELWVT